MFLGLSTLIRDIFQNEPIVESSPDTIAVANEPIILRSITPVRQSILVANTTEAAPVVVLWETMEEDDNTMHHTTATGLVVTGLLVLICVALFALCFLLRKYCRCAYNLNYTLNYGKVPRGSVLVSTEDQMEAGGGDMSKRSTLNMGGDSGIGINSRHPSETRLTQSRPQSPNQQRPPRPPPSTRGSLPRQSAEQRPLLATESTTLSVQPTGLYPAVDTASHTEAHEAKVELK